MTLIYFLIFKKIDTEICDLKFIKSQLAKLAILLLLKPEWLAKSEHCSAEQQSKKYIQTISKHISKLLKNTSIFKQIYKAQMQSLLNCKNMKSANLIRKIEGNQVVLKELFTWLNKQSFTSNHRVSTNFIRQAYYRDELYHILIAVYNMGLEWYIYTNLKNKNLYLHSYFINYAEQIIFLASALNMNLVIMYLSKFICNKSINLKTLECKIFNKHCQYLNIIDIEIRIQQKRLIVVRPNEKSLKSLLYTIRSKLYDRNIKGYWRINNQIRMSKALLFINYLLQSWYSYHFNILDSLDKEIITKAVDKILYLWQRKKTKK